MRLRLFQIIQRAHEGDEVSRCYDFFIVTVAFLSILPLMFKDEATPPDLALFMDGLDIVTVFILFADYILRWATHDIRTGDGVKSFFLYPFSPMAIIDLLSILPSITVLHNGFKFLRILRIVRILRMFNGLTIVTNVFIKERRALYSVIFFIFVYIFGIALIMFTVEPNTFTTFLDALYWSTTALATIGYGDIYPVTGFGKLIATISSIVGICVIAFPAGIITGGYINQLNQAKSQGREYFSLPLRHDKTFKGRPISSYKNFRNYFKRNKKVKVYLITMIICLFVGVFSAIISYANPYFSIFNELAIAMISVLLEPCAGILLGIVSDFIYAITINNAGGILYFGASAFTVIAFGVLCRRGKKIDFSTIIKIYLLCVVITVIYEYVISLIIYSTKHIDPSFMNYYQIINISQFINCDYVTALTIFEIGSRTISASISIAMMVIIRKLVWGSKLDPYTYIPKTKRYKYKIYRRRKNEHSYLVAWLESFSEKDDENRDYEMVAQVGQQSIEKSKKHIRTKREKIQDIQEDLQEHLDDIEQIREEIVQTEKAINVKKKAVRKAKRKAVVKSITSKNDDDE